MLYFFQKLEKISQNLSSAAVVIGALRVKSPGLEAIAHQKCLFILENNDYNESVDTGPLLVSHFIKEYNHGRMYREIQGVQTPTPWKITSGYMCP